MKIVCCFITFISIAYGQLFRLTFLVSQEGCKNPPSIENGTAYRLTHFPSPVFYQCDDGYLLVGRRYNYCIKGKWTVDSKRLPACVRVTDRACSGTPERPRNGRISLSRPGYKVEFICNTGYQLIGDKSTYCVNETWAPSVTRCVFDICRRQPCANNAICTNRRNQSFSCKCREGFYGNGKRRCRRLCTPPVHLMPGGILYEPRKESYRIGDRVTISCAEGYEPKRSGKMVCGNGLFVPVGRTDLLHCRISSCPPPSVPPNGGIVDNKNGTRRIGEVVSYYCNERFLLIGTKNITCQSDGTYDNSRPRCVAMCEPPTPPFNGGYEPAERPFFLYLDEVTYFCNNNETPGPGASVATCMENHVFSPPAPYCPFIFGSGEEGS